MGDAVAASGSWREQAEAAIAISRRSPAAARTLAIAARRGAAAAGDGRSESIALRALALAAREEGRFAEARSLLRSAIRTAAAVGGADEEGLARGSLASVLLLAGDLHGALTELDHAASLVSGGERALIAMQRGVVLGRLGELDRAAAALDEAVDIAGAGSDRATLGLVLVNRGVLRVYCGDAAGADRDLAEAERLLEAEGQSITAADAHHNRGFAALARGDVVGALRLFDEARAAHERLGVPRPMARLDEANALLDVRLLPEARAAAAEAERALRASGELADAAEAALTAATAAGLAGDLAGAIRAADRAAAAFDEQGREPWAALARSVHLRAALAAGEQVPFESVIDAVDEVGTHGWAEAAVELLVAAGGRLLSTARERGDAVRGGAGGALVTRLEEAAATDARLPATRRALAAHADALLHLLRGDEAAAAAAVAVGLEALADAVASLGATEMRTAVVAAGSELAALGVELAVATGDAGRVLLAAEQARAISLQSAAGPAPHDRELSEDLARLRAITRQRDASPAGGNRNVADTADLLAEQARTERRIAKRARLLRATPASAGAFDVAELEAELAGAVLVEIVQRGEDLWAVVVAPGVRELVRLGAAGEVMAATAALRFTLRRAGAAKPRQSLLDAARAAADRLDQAVGRLTVGRSASGPRTPAVVVPTGALHGLPWAALGSFASRPLSVAPSAAVWLRASRRRRAGGAGPQAARQVVLVAGPGLPGAAAEVDRLQAVHPGARVLAGRDATVERVLGAVEGAGLVHLAAHGTFRADSPMFSSLGLYDGPLTVHDLEGLREPPATVVLSACDAAVSEVRSGDELLGVASGLLGIGATAVVASVLPVPDDTTADLAEAVHREMLAGLGPAAALASAHARRGAIAPGVRIAPFVVLGAG